MTEPKILFEVSNPLPELSPDETRARMQDAVDRLRDGAERLGYTLLGPTILRAPHP